MAGFVNCWLSILKDRFSGRERVDLIKFLHIVISVNQVIPVILIRIFDSIFNFVPERFVFFPQKIVLRSSGPFEGLVFFTNKFLNVRSNPWLWFGACCRTRYRCIDATKNVSTKAFQVPSTSFSMIILYQSVLRSLSNTGKLYGED